LAASGFYDPFHLPHSMPPVNLAIFSYFYPEDGGCVFLLNGINRPDHSVSKPGRMNA